MFTGMAQSPAPLVEIADIHIIDEYHDELGYYLFSPATKASATSVPVVFVHGYGALNPMIYGQWIRHLVGKGHTVIYPRYQKDLLGTSPRDFVMNTATAVSSALERLEGPEDGLFFIGHSYGGVIIANLAANWRAFHLPEPRIAFLCEPGSGPFNGGVLESYETMDSTLYLTIMVGDKDETVGQDFGRMVYESAVLTPHRVLLWQYACEQDSFSVSASHYEPYAIDHAFDNGIENFTSRKALRVARLDHVDVHGYWEVFDLMVAKTTERSTSKTYATRDLEQFADLGTWPDGTPLCVMDCHHPGLGEQAGK
jgi:pimeloyl-ACP methyl ester carboxylesterase